MLIRPRTVPLLLASSLALAATQGRAQDEIRVLDEVRTCAELQRDSVRLACFDAIARAAASGSPAAAAPAPSTSGPVARAPVAPPPAPSVARQAPQAAESFDLPTEPPPRAGREPIEQEVVSSVASLREIQPGRLEVTLANGQVWRQVNSDRYPLAVGHEVRIYPTRFGGYFRLTARELRRFVQVERVR